MPEESQDAVSTRGTTDNAVAFVQRWRAILDTQMHFNDMLMRTRATAGSIVLAAFGAAAVSIAQHPDRLIRLPGTAIHVASVIVVAGLLLLTAVFVLDYFYFYRMLLAVVRLGVELEVESRQPTSPIELEVTGCIAKAVPERLASLVILVFYGIPFVAGLVFLGYLVAL